MSVSGAETSIQNFLESFKDGFRRAGRVVDPRERGGCCWFRGVGLVGRGFSRRMFRPMLRR